MSIVSERTIQLVVEGLRSSRTPRTVVELVQIVGKGETPVRRALEALECEGRIVREGPRNRVQFRLREVMQ